MSDDSQTFLKMSQQLGEMSGILRSHIKHQEKTNAHLVEVVEKQDSRIGRN